MKEPPHAIRRTACPVCTSVRCTIAHGEELSDPKFVVPLTALDPSLKREEFDHWPYEIARCDDCTLLYQVYIADAAISNFLYSRENEPGSLEKKRRGRFIEFVGRAREAERIGALVQQPPYRIRVLEFGAGWGLWSQVAAAYGYEVHALDVSAVRLRHAASLGLAVHTSLTELEDASFDFVYSDQVFEHIEEPRAAMQGLVRKIRPGGWLRIGVPDATHSLGILKTVQGPIKALYPLKHINGFTHASLIRLAEDTGLSWVSGYEVARRIMKQTSYAQSLFYFQEAARVFVGQGRGTALYFARRAP